MDFFEKINKHELWLSSNFMMGNKICMDSEKISDALIKSRQMADAFFNQCSFLNCTFENTDLFASFFAGCSFENSSFINCNISKSNFDYVSFKNVKFIKCKILRTSFYKTDLEGAEIIDSIMMIN